MSLAVVGAVALDDIATPAGGVRGVLGGSASYAAAAAALLTEAHIVSVVGDDLPASTFDPLRARGVHLEGLCRVPGATFRWGCRYQANLEDRETLFTEPGTFATATIAVPAAAARATHLVLTAGEPRQNRAALAAFAHRRLTLFDTIERELREQRRQLLEILAHVDIVSINAAEVALLLGANAAATPTDPAALAQAGHGFLAARGPGTLLLKRGAQGADVIDAAGRTTIGAFPAPAVVDPTGAGDAFLGGVASALLRGAPLPDAVRWGCAVASFTVEAFGLAGLLGASREGVAERAAQLGLREAPWLAPARAGASA